MILQCGICITPTPQITISGIVREYQSNLPIGNASVSLDGYHDFEVQTDEQGSFAISNIPAYLNYILQISKPTYSTYTATISAGGININLGTIVLDIIPNPPQNVQVLIHENNNSATVSWLPFSPENGSRQDRPDRKAGGKIDSGGWAER